MENIVLNKIIELIEEKMGKYDFPISRDTCLEKDLGLSGDDAVQFIILFGKKFAVDVSRFMASDYFSGEGIDLLGTIFRGLLRGDKEKSVKKELTVYHLEKAVRAGRLTEEIINN